MYKGLRLNISAQLIMAILVILSIFIPHFKHFHIAQTPVAESIVEQLKTVPPTSALSSLAKMGIGISLGISDAEILNSATEILSGQLDVPSFLDHPLPLRGYPSDFELGSPTFRLVIASLQIEDLLLSAYEKTGDRKFLKYALSRVLNFCNYENQQIQDQGFLWNDHAIASRVAVLAKLWKHVRDNSDVAQGDKQTIIALAQKSGRMLANAEHFTVQTNHGVMQNIGLLQITAAFPLLPEAAAWRTLALARLELQLEFYVSDEGMVLEHSATYHKVGNELLHMANELALLNDIPVPTSIARAISKTAYILDVLQRPDLSLPNFGNTDESPSIELTTAPPHNPRNQSTLLPLSGYAIWWGDDIRNDAQVQSVIAWADHKFHGHKHADETSVHLWSEGTDWITSTGYWPYETPGFDAANGWRGSNAVHLTDESAHSQRIATLVSYGDSKDVRFIDINRRGPGSFETRRQVIQLNDGRLIVLDFSSGAEVPVNTLWTFDHRLDLRKIDAGVFESSQNSSGTRIQVSTTGKPVASFTLARGEMNPFTGWFVKNRKQQAAPSIVVTQPGKNSYRATVFELKKYQSSLREDRSIALNDNATPDKWILKLDQMRSIISLDENQLTIRITGSVEPKSIKLSPAPNLITRQQKLKSSMHAAMIEYPKWRNLYSYRLKLSYFLVGITLISLCCWLVLVRFKRNLAETPWLYTMALFWMTVALWSHFIYFRV